ncbi:MAG: serine/threonine protein kinase [Bacteroidales bacterium]|nr:serine/threonine protein kinase [Bacteroidales bacterium]
MEQALDKGTVLQSSANSYTISRALGQGSFGITYLANTKFVGALGAINVEVALKEFFMKEINSREGSSVTGGGSSRDSLFDKYRQKFRREAQNLSRMEHPGIVKVIEAFDTNGTSYIAMEYLGGGSLDDLIASRGRLPEADALRYIRAIGEALSYMHAHQMLHLDLKPSNVMLNRQGEPVIIDFGLSKQYDESGNPESSTTVGGGTPGYAPIEQAGYRDGEGFPVTMDVYALGATLFKMLCGHRPPDADRVMNDGFPYGDLKGVSQATVDVVAKAMAYRKAERYQTVDEFLAALGAPVSSADEATALESEETEVEVARVVSTPANLKPQPQPKVPPKTKTPPPTQPTPPQKKSLLWLWITLPIVLAVGIVAVVIWGMQESPEALAKEYAQKMCECQTLEKEYGKEDDAKKCYDELKYYTEDLDKRIENEFTEEERDEFGNIVVRYFTECGQSSEDEQFTGKKAD